VLGLGRWLRDLCSLDGAHGGLGATLTWRVAYYAHAGGGYGHGPSLEGGLLCTCWRGGGGMVDVLLRWEGTRARSRKGWATRDRLFAMSF